MTERIIVINLSSFFYFWDGFVIMKIIELIVNGSSGECSV